MTCDSIQVLNNAGELPSFVAGDLWDGIQQIGPVVFNVMPPPTDLTRIDMTFRKAVTDIDPAYVFSTEVIVGAGLILITDAVNWLGYIAPQPLPLAPGKWIWSMKFHGADNSDFTPAGGSITILSHA